MPYRMPYPLPQKYEGANAIANPGVTLPVPGPGQIPTPCWFASPTTIFWTASAAFPNGFATWNSPLFDLRPNLQGFNPYGRSGADDRTQRPTPVWVGGGGGGGGQLFIQISNLLSTANSLTNLEVLAQEYGHISDPGKSVTLTPQQDITTSINSTTNSVVLSFLPIGEGLPMRYWKLLLIFQRTAAGGSNDPFEIEAAYY